MFVRFELIHYLTNHRLNGCCTWLVSHVLWSSKLEYMQRVRSKLIPRWSVVSLRLSRTIAAFFEELECLIAVA